MTIKRECRINNPDARYRSFDFALCFMLGIQHSSPVKLISINSFIHSFISHFVWFSHHDQGQQSCYTFRPYRSVIPFIRLLLASVPKDSYSGLVMAMYGIRDVTELPSPPVANDDTFSLPSTSQHWPVDN